MLFDKFLSVQKRQQRLLARVSHPAARHYLKTPLPDKQQSLDEVCFITLDFETTGLDARHEAILSMGYTRLCGSCITMRDCIHRVIRLNTPLPPDSVTIHQITDDRMQAGMPLHDALHELVEQMAGCVLLVHYEPIERRFLQQAMSKVYGHALPLMMVDTLALEQRRLRRQQASILPGQLRLAQLREQYGLPRYGAHHALEDAIATAELFMAQCFSMQGAGRPLCLGDVLNSQA